MKKINIFDTDKPFYEAKKYSVLWQDSDDLELPNSIVIPRIVEENADLLRSRYLAWIHDFGEMDIRGRRLLEYFRIRCNFSYWWMTLLAGKSNWALSPQIEDGIRLLAFIFWAEQRSIEEIKLFSANDALAECLSSWCEKSKIQFEWEKISQPNTQVSVLYSFYSLIPVALQAWIWLVKYVFDRMPLIGAGLREWKRTKGRTTFITYSTNCSADLSFEKRYQNRYWSKLPGVLDDSSCKSNWLHIFVKDDVLPNAKSAAKAIDGFNSAARGHECHATVDTFMNFRVIANTIRDWIFVVRVAFFLGGQIKSATTRLPYDLWPLLSKDWRSSTYGKLAMYNLLYLNLFEAATKSLPTQHQGVYLQENMAWEFGLLHAWDAAGHERLLGAPHSTVRFWDLRYFFDPRSYRDKDKLRLPLPHKVACNGPVVRSAFERCGYPKKDLVDVEALRFLHLGNAKLAMHSFSKGMNNPKRLLVLGDYLARNTDLQMGLLARAMIIVDRQLEITVKPHPNYPIKPSEYPTLKFAISNEPIGKLLSENDIAFAGAMTTAAVDAFCIGIPIITVLDLKTLNLSPLRECPGALFARTPKELAEALITAVSYRFDPQNIPKYFEVGDELPKWRKLLRCR